jgi:hypothetical protein
MKDMDQLKKENEYYEKMFGVGDVATRGYIAVVKQLEQQISFLDDFELEKYIDTVSKDSPLYDRAQKIFKEMPEIIISLKELKDKLGIEYVEKETKVSATTPQSIAKLNM